MIDCIKLKNLTSSTEVLMNKTFGNPYIIEKIDWGSASANHTKYDNLTGAGSIIANTKIQERTVTITGNVCSVRTNKQIAVTIGDANISAIYASREAEINGYKKVLSTLINPLDMLQITNGQTYIQGKPSSSIVFGNEEADNNEILCKFSISIDCSNPMFASQQGLFTMLSGTSGAFQFPLILKKSGIIMGVRKRFQIVAIENSGDTSVGGIIHLKSLGTVINPTFTNVYTQETIKLNRTLGVGEEVAIDTTKRTVMGSINDGATWTTYLKYWSYNSQWIQFPVGNTLFGFSADGESYNQLDVMVELNPERYSMEGQ